MKMIYPQQQQSVMLMVQSNNSTQYSQNNQPMVFQPAPASDPYVPQQPMYKTVVGDEGQMTVQ